MLSGFLHVANRYLALSKLSKLFTQLVLVYLFFLFSVIFVISQYGSIDSSVPALAMNFMDDQNIYM